MKQFAVIFCVVGMLLSKTAFGQMKVTLDYSPSQYTFNPSGGGEFRAYPSGTPNLLTSINTAAYAATTSGVITGQYYFQTFCIESNVSFDPGVTYNVSISPNALYGNQPPFGDPVSIGTAWLYSQFAAGTLVGLTAGDVPSPYNYTYGFANRVQSAGQLQDTIWWLENEPTVGDPGLGNVFRNAVLNQYGTAAAAMANANGAFGVMALNLGAPGLVQDQLVIVPVVPEPATAAFIVTGALLLAAKRRRLSQT